MQGLRPYMPHRPQRLCIYKESIEKCGQWTHQHLLLLGLMAEFHVCAAPLSASKWQMEVAATTHRVLAPSVCGS